MSQLAFNLASRRSRTRSLRVLVACEFSDTVRNAFLDRGHYAWSCDLCRQRMAATGTSTAMLAIYLNDGWDMLMVAHPPCTRLCNSGVRWLSAPPPGRTVDEMWAELDEGAALFSAFWNAPIDRICIENPVMHKHAKERIQNYEEFAMAVRSTAFERGGMTTFAPAL